MRKILTLTRLIFILWDKRRIIVIVIYFSAHKNRHWYLGDGFCVKNGRERKLHYKVSCSGKVWFFSFLNCTSYDQNYLTNSSKNRHHLIHFTDKWKGGGKFYEPRRWWIDRGVVALLAKPDSKDLEERWSVHQDCCSRFHGSKRKFNES